MWVGYPTARRSMTGAPVAWRGSRRGGLPRISIALVLALVLTLGGAAAALGMRAAFAPPSRAAQMFDDVRYAALFAGHDPAAAVRKARFRTRLMMRTFAMTRDQAATYVARLMIGHSGSLCSGF